LAITADSFGTLSRRSALATFWFGIYCRMTATPVTRANLSNLFDFAGAKAMTAQQRGTDTTAIRPLRVNVPEAEFTA